jgi:alginate O-acetyltransferase complex protein AlgJ
MKLPSLPASCFLLLPLAASLPSCRSSGTKENTAAATADAAVPEKKSGFFGRLFGGKKESGPTEKDAARRSAAETAFLAECATLAQPGGTVQGRDGWLFSAAELSAVARSGNTAPALGSIADYAAQLRSMDCDLIVVPVPPKTLVYPDKVARTTKLPGKRKSVPRLDGHWTAALQSLESRNIRTVDLLPVFLEDRRSGGPEPYTMTSSTWSPHGAQLAAASIAKAVLQSGASRLAGSVEGITREPAQLSFLGSLASGTTPAPKPESLPVMNVGRIEGDKVRSVSFSTSGSNLLLMGDSSAVLSWRENGNPIGSSGAFSSLADHLAATLGGIPDVLSAPGDGRNAPRLRIMRERTAGRNPLASTRAVVWVIPMTDLASTNWQTVPLQLNFSLEQPEIQLR